MHAPAATRPALPARTRQQPGRGTREGLSLRPQPLLLSDCDAELLLSDSRSRGSATSRFGSVASRRGGNRDCVLLLGS